MSTYFPPKYFPSKYGSKYFGVKIQVPNDPPINIGDGGAYFAPGYFGTDYFAPDYFGIPEPEIVFQDIIAFSVDIQTQTESVLSINRQMEKTTKINRQIELTVEL